MTTDKPELALGNMRREHQSVTSIFQLFAQKVFHLFANGSAFGMPEDQALPVFFMDRKEIEFASQPPVIALLRFLTLLEPCVQFVLREKSGAVD
jgi:hypothetical protein